MTTASIVQDVYLWASASTRRILGLAQNVTNVLSHARQGLLNIPFYSSGNLTWRWTMLWCLILRLRKASKKVRWSPESIQALWESRPCICHPNSHKPWQDYWTVSADAPCCKLLWKSCFAFTSESWFEDLNSVLAGFPTQDLSTKKMTLINYLWSRHPPQEDEELMRKAAIYEKELLEKG